MRRRRRILESLLLLAGVLAIDVWIWSHAVTAIFQRLDERNFERRRTSISPVQPMLPSPGRDARLGRLIIPRLHLRTMVREGVGEDTLSIAAGHIPSTALPGQRGNVGIAAHRDTLFRGLKDIHKDDLILFETVSGSYRYRVERTEIVKPNDVSVLNSDNSPELTLVTCYPFYYVGNAPDRFIVKARQVTEESATTAPTGATSEPPAQVIRARAKAPAPQQRHRKRITSRPRRLELAAAYKSGAGSRSTARWR